MKRVLTLCVGLLCACSDDSSSIPDGKVQADSTLSCQTDPDCKVFSDCCSCAAVAQGSHPAQCERACVQDACAAWGLKSPAAYCFEGTCRLSDKPTPGCQTTADCQLLDDCCVCLALPKAAINTAGCPMASCATSTCATSGLTGVKADCVQGICRLVR